MHLRLIAVGTRMPAWVSAGYEDYARRLPRELKIELVEIPLAARGNNADIPRLKSTEGERILKAVDDARLIALDENGSALSTLQWADALTGWMRDGRDVALAVGGPCRAGRRWARRSRRRRAGRRRGALVVIEADAATCISARGRGRAVVSGLERHGKSPLPSRLTVW